MHQLIAQARAALPFDAPEAQICAGDCDGCALKLLDYLDGELLDWEQRLATGDKPSFGDLSRLAKISRKVYTVVERNGLIMGHRQASSPNIGPPAPDHPRAS